MRLILISGRCRPCKVFVDHFFLVNQVGCLHHKIHQLVGVGAPGVQSLQGILKSVEVNGLRASNICVNFRSQ